AMKAGIGMVHQHFMLVPVFTVAENVMLGHEQTKFGGVLDLAAARAKVREISDRFGFDIDPDAVVENLPVGVQQRVEIIKALSRDAQVLVFDEPTAVLTPQETDELMAIMRQLKEAGTAIVFITHKLREVREVADRITVIRLGKVVGEASPTATNSELASMMVGRAVELTIAKEPAQPGEDAFVITDLSVIDRLNQYVVKDVSLTVRAGEILAIAGVQGNGQTELTEAILGIQPRATGSIKLDGVELLGKSVRRVIDAGVGFVPEDRTQVVLVESMATSRLSTPWIFSASVPAPPLLSIATASIVSARACGACSTRASASCPKTAPRTGSSRASRSPRTSCSTDPTASRSSNSAPCSSRRSKSSPKRSCANSTSARRASTPSQDASRAATSRRSCSRAS